LVVVFLIPWLEGSARLRSVKGLASLDLASPWTIFYWLLLVAGVTNFLPTRYGPAATVVGLALTLEYLGLTHTDWTDRSRALVWQWVAWLLALGIWVADWCASKPVAGGTDFERLWLWFRDHWGVVWAIRIEDRFNRSAESSGWLTRLTWFGVTQVESSPKAASSTPPDQAEAMLRGLIRRFADPDRLDEVSRGSASGSCDSRTAAG
jgi:hypothetical protein